MKQTDKTTYEQADKIDGTEFKSSMGTGAKYIVSQVHYIKGRGYYAVTRITTREVSEHFTSESFALFSNPYEKRELLEGSNRFSAKRLSDLVVSGTTLLLLDKARTEILGKFKADKAAEFMAEHGEPLVESVG